MQSVIGTNDSKYTIARQKASSIKAHCRLIIAKQFIILAEYPRPFLSENVMRDVRSLINHFPQTADLEIGGQIVVSTSFA